jgi:hypothetical protein
MDSKGGYVNGEHWIGCTTCHGEHVANDKHTIATPEGARRHYCAVCWPEAAGLEALRQMAIGAARQGKLLERAADVLRVLERARNYDLIGTGAAALAGEILDAIDDAGETAGKVGW